MQAPQQVPPQQIVYVQQAPLLNAKSTGSAIFLAFLWPGLDRLYLEDTTKGVIFFILAPILWLTIIGGLILWIHSMATASKRAAVYNSNLMRQSQQMMPSQQMIK